MWSCFSIPHRDKKEKQKHIGPPIGGAACVVTKFLQFGHFSSMYACWHQILCTPPNLMTLDTIIWSIFIETQSLFRFCFSTSVCPLCDPCFPENIQFHRNPPGFSARRAPTDGSLPVFLLSICETPRVWEQGRVRGWGGARRTDPAARQAWSGPRPHARSRRTGALVH